MKPPEKSPLSAQLNFRLTAYAGAAAATAALAPGAQASVVYSGPVSISVPNNIDGIYLDLVTGQASTNAFSNYDFNPYSSSNSLTFYLPSSYGDGVVGTTANGATPLTPGVSVISSSSSFLTSVVSASAFRAVSSIEFAGVKFVNDTTGATNYGWIELTTTSGGGFPASIVGYAYENTGAGIIAGQIAGPGQTPSVPEPGTTVTLGLGMLALGAAGVRHWRRSKQMAA